MLRMHGFLSGVPQVSYPFLPVKQCTGQFIRLGVHAR